MQYIKRILFCLAAMLTVFAVSLVSAQTKAIDSLEQLLQKTGDDTTLVRLNLQLSAMLTSYNIAAAEKYLEAGHVLTKKIKNDYYTALYVKQKGELLFDKANYDQSGISFDTALVLFDRLIIEAKNDTEKKKVYILAKTDCLIGKGLVAAKQYKYHESMQYYLDGIAAIEHLAKADKSTQMATLYLDIASNYYELEQFEESLKYDRQVLPYLDSNNSLDMYVIGYLFVADDFSSLSKFDSSTKYLETVRPVVERLNKPNLNVRFYYILGNIQRKKKQWADALTSFQKANEAAEKMKDDFQSVNSEEGIAASYLQLGNLDKAREIALMVFNESNRINLPLGKMLALQLLAELEEKAGNISKAFQYQKQFITISDSIKKEKVHRQMQDIQTKYQTEKKEKEIIQLQKNNAVQSLSLQKKSTFNYFLIGSVAALLITGFLGYRNLHHRQQLAKQQEQLQQQRIRELEMDKQLVAVDSMLKGQEEERSRLAKDLHDGLGGLLSGVKFSLSNMKDNLIITPDNMAVFERSLDMIDTSIKELRRVAHNMMPEMLTKFGLDEALKEYCNTINATKLLSVKYQSVGMDTRIEKSSEIIIYRIIQELINNILKHGAATEAMVQLIKDDRRVSIIAEDNGKGFDTTLLKNSKGAGLISIKSRVEYLKGQLDIHSEHGKGTLVNIELNI